MPKRYQPKKWHMITDLSFPEGASVNQAINPASCSLSYTTVYEVAIAAMQLGCGAFLAKTDIKSAYMQLERVYKVLGVQLAPEKKDGPTHMLVYLSITIDSQQGELRLPADKLQRLTDAVATWLSKKKCTRKELESLISTLHHACKVIRPGRSFLRRAISLLSAAKQRHHHICLNVEFRSNMMWWQMFASRWNGAAIIIPQGPPDVTIITSDASESWGCGAWYGNKWFQLQWPVNIELTHIAVKELIPIIIATRLVWGPHLLGKPVLSNCGNSAMVSVLNSHYIKI